MLERFKRAARDRLIRAVREANDGPESGVRRALKEQADRERGLEQQLRELRDELRVLREQVGHFERRERRDLTAAGDRQAVESSARYVADHFLTAHVLPSPFDTLRYALEQAPTDALALEFGVASGRTLRIIADHREDTVYGFDVFTGLPEDWRPGFREGRFKVDELPQIEGAELVAGLFDDTLPGFLADHPGPVDFVHVDCDLYSATVTVLDAVGPRLRAGSVVLFDEYFNHQNWQAGEVKAWAEYVERTGLTYEYIAYTGDGEQVAVRVESLAG